MTLEDCRGRCSMDYSIPIDEVKLWRGPQLNLFLNRSSKWSSVSRARILEEERENSRDGKFLSNQFFVSFWSGDFVWFGFNWPSFPYQVLQPRRRRLQRLPLQRGKRKQESFPYSTDLWVLLLWGSGCLWTPKGKNLFLKTFDDFLSLLARWSVHATETWSNSGTTKRKTTASPSTTADVKGMGTSLTLSPSVRTG